MNTQFIANRNDGSIPSSMHPPLSLDQFIEQSGLSPATCWRFRKRGWLRTVNISGRHYVTREEIAEFNARAARGEFSGKVMNPQKSAGVSA